MKRGDKQFIYYWYKEFAWKNNPFEKRFPKSIEDFIVGYEKERKKLNYFVIDKLPLAIITGKEGYGKSTLLLWLKEELSKYRGVVIVDYINKDVSFTNFIKMLLQPILTIKEKLAEKGSKISIKSLKLIKDKDLVAIYDAIYFRRATLDITKIKNILSSRLKGKPLVLLVDDFDSVDYKLTELLKVLLNSQMNIQIAVASKDSVKGLNKKGSMKVSLGGLNLNECKSMVSKRMLSVGGDGLTPFSNDIFNILFRKSRGNPLLFLDLCKEKAVNLSLSNLSLKREGIVEDKQKEIINSAVEQTSDKKVESKKIPEKKLYEIKVVNSQSDKDYKFTTINQRSDYKPREVKKERTKVVKEV